MTVFMAEVGWLEFQYRKWLVLVHFLHAEVCMVWSELGEHLVSMNEMLPS